MPNSSFSLLAVVLAATTLQPAASASADAVIAAAVKSEDSKIVTFKPEQQASKGSVTVAGKRLDYDAYAGTFVVHLKGYDDVPQNVNKDDKVGPAEASMFYAAYFKSGVPSAQRPITFLFNGGPGSSSVWLHMGAFGPRRVVTLDNAHTPAAPYSLVNNEYSLLDASDLVFIDAPGTGFSRVAGKDREKAFFGVDPDAHAFAEFITDFLSKWGRWNSPKYIFGESYGTTRAAAVVHLLQTDSSVDLNGVILLSQCLNYDVLPDYPELNPAVDQPYELWLPSYAATAWYHHRLPAAPKDLPSLMADVERFTSGEYAAALDAGSTLESAERAAVVKKLHEYHRAAPGLYREGESTHLARRVPESAARRCRSDDRCARYALLRSDAGPHEQGGGLRPSISRNQFGLCERVQRLCAQGIEIRRRQGLSRVLESAGLEFLASAARAAARN